MGQPPRRTSDPSFAGARRRIQKQIEDAERDQQRRLFRQRIDIANAGVRAYQNKRFQEAVLNFTQYLRVLENYKNVPEGGLNPSCFDLKGDAAELLLISGIYWDLAKLYDRTTTPGRFKEFMVFLEKYVLFSKGMPFEALCAETMRKYIYVEKPVHLA